MSNLSLASDFPTRSREDWLALVDETLKGADFDKRLVSETYDGLKVQPLYTGEDARTSVVPLAGGGAAWCIAQAIADPDAAAANAAILADLEGGATGIVLRMAASPAAAGVQIWTAAHMGRALKDVRLDAVPLYLDAGARGPEAAALLLAHASNEGIDPAAMTGAFGLDPSAALAATGALPAGPADYCAVAASLAEAGTNMQAVGISTQPFSAAGCSEAQELAIALATGVARLRGLEAAGMELAKADAALRFVLTTDADVFGTIAKFRAWRALWTKVLSACGLDRAAAAPDAETASRMMTRRDPWVNMLRATAATFGAAAGGARTITVAPYSDAIGLPDGFARRIARNAQVILQEESHVAQVADAASGSWYLEDLTSALTDEAWTLFQSIEAAGGIIAALKSGIIQEIIGEVREVRGRDIAKRKLAVTGVSEFPNLGEKAVTAPGKTSGGKVDTDPAGDLDGLLSIAKAGSAPAFATTGGLVCDALAANRLAEPFEALRDASEAADARPQITLVRLGTASDFTARAGFAQNFFEAGGIEAVFTDGGDDDFDLTPSAVACICSSDAVYGTHAAGTAKALREAGATRVYLAGRPGDLETELNAAGVDAYIFAGCDVVDCLEDLHRHLGLER